MVDVPKDRVALGAPAYILYDIFRNFKSTFPEKYQTVFTPDLTYEEVAINTYTTRLTGDVEAYLKGKTFPLFSYTRGPAQRFDEQEHRFNARSFFKYTDPDSGDIYHMDLRAALTRFDVMFRAYFQDAAEYERFEATYRNFVSINEHRKGEVVLPYIDRPAAYTLVWNDLEEVDWKVTSNNFIAVNFSLEVMGTSFVYIGDKRGIEKIILEIRDYDHPDVLYSSQEFQLQPRPPKTP